MFWRIFKCCLVSLLPLMPAAQATELHYAQNFEIEDFGTHRILTVRNALRQKTPAQRYALVPKDQPVPELPDGVPIIRTPVERIVVMETVHVGYLEALGRIDRIVGAASIEFINNPAIQQGAAEGRIRRLQGGQLLDVETLLTLQPDLVLTSVAADPAFDVPAKLQRAALPVVPTAGYLEAHPLARAEWIKFIAEFVDQREAAEQTFEAVATRYRELTALTANPKRRPTILCGAPYAGVWHVPGGRSYTAQTIEDAGGHYLWRDNTSRGGVPLDLETIFLKGAAADLWINPGAHRTLPSLLAADPRFQRFQAARKGRAFNLTRQVTPTGGNAIWESGIARPDLVLADLIRIFHPDLLPDHTLVYYEALE